MIRILIIEDEIPARKKLNRFIVALQADTTIIKEIGTVQEAVSFLQNQEVDLIFSDIELLDGNAFDIYQQVNITAPIIFITAYDQFLMDAFETNGIAYLLKPYTNERFLQAWNKFLILQKAPENELLMLQNLSKLINQNIPIKTYKKRFTVSSNQGIYFIEIADILFFEATDGLIFAYDTLHNKHILTESTLKEIEQQLHPEEFFRINRSELVHKRYVVKIERYTKNTLALKIKNYSKALITSQSNTAAFREWIEK